MNRKVLILPFLMIALSLSSCNQKQPKIIGYSIDESNNIVAIYDNETTETIGNLTDEDVANHVTSVTISQDGYFVINGIKTNHLVSFSSVSISNDGYYVVDGIKTSIKASYNSITVSEDGYYVVDGIKTNIVATHFYTVSFNTGYSASVPNQKIEEGHKVERPSISRTGYDLDGWFCNGEEWRFNSDVVLNNMTLTAQWTAKQYTVSFINEMGDNPADITVTYDAQYTLPNVDAVTGYTFAGWYYNSTKYSGGKWTTDANITLTAKWTANTYTVTLNPGVGSVSKTTQTVTYGQSYTLPVPTNDYGVFVGWLLDGEAVTDNQGHSLSPWTYTENKTFTVDWEIKVYTASDLASMSSYPNAAFKLMNDIDLDGITWIPVGTVNSMFKGTLDGNGHSIKNLAFNTSNQTSATYGLFGYVDGATIKNLWMKDFSFTSQNIGRSYAVGSFFAVTLSSNTTQIINCKATGSYSMAAQSSTYEITAGGFAGEAYNAYFEKCINEISFSNALYGGGIVGKSAFAVVFSNCLNKGNVSGKSAAGGLIGYVKAFSASTCLNEGNITAEKIAGGIAGKASAGSSASSSNIALIGVVNKGNITGTATTGDTFEGVGGIIGSVFDSSSGITEVYLDKTYNSGTISGSQAGGLISYPVGGTIVNSYNSGDIRGYDSAGGIASNAISTNFVQCLASGSLSVNGSITKMSTIAFGVSGVQYTDCYHTFTNTSNYIGKNGTYTDNCYGSSLYKDLMYWGEYNSYTGEGDWIYHDDGYPTLSFESSFNSLEEAWAL